MLLLLDLILLKDICLTNQELSNTNKEEAIESLGSPNMKLEREVMNHGKVK